VRAREYTTAMSAAGCFINDPETGRPLIDLHLLRAGTLIVNEARRLSRVACSPGKRALHDFLHLPLVMNFQIALKEKTHISSF